MGAIFELRSKKGSTSLIPRLHPLSSDTFALLALFPSAPVKTIYASTRKILK
jgi:hypothetical protein